MTKLMESLFSKVKALPEDQQDALAKGWLVDLDEPLLSPELRAELDRRLADADAHPERLIPAAKVLADLRERLRK